jgi:hypothetical protein
MSQAKRTADRGGERDAEAGGGPAAAVVAALAPKALKLDRPQPVGADQLLVLDGQNRRQVRPPPQLLPEHVPGEVPGRGIVLRPVALGAAPLGIQLR